MSKFIPLMALWAFFAACAPSQPKPQASYMQQLPTMADVSTHIKGTDPADTYHRQHAAYTLLQKIVTAYQLSPGVDDATSIRQKQEEYSKGLSQVYKQYHALYPGLTEKDSDRQLRSKSYEYEGKKSRREEILGHLLSKQLQEEVAATVAAQQALAKRQEYNRENPNPIKWQYAWFVAACIPFFYASIACFRKIRKKGNAIDKAQFERTNKYGVQEFASHEEKIQTESQESRSILGLQFLTVIMVVCFFSGILIIVGGLTLMWPN